MFHNGGKGLDDSYRNYSIEFGATYQPVNALKVSAFPSYSINNDKLQYIQNSIGPNGPIYLNGEIEQHTLAMSLRVNYTINPNLSVQYWGQPFISQGRFSNFKKVTNALAKDFGDRYLLYPSNQISMSENRFDIDENGDGMSDVSFNNPDFSFIKFRAGSIYRALKYFWFGHKIYRNREIRKSHY